MSAEAIPEIIRAAGDAAVRAYREFLDDPTRKPGTRKAYRQSIDHFFRWAEARKLALTGIAAGDVQAYLGELLASLAAGSVMMRQSALRGLFRCQVAADVLAVNPFPAKVHRQAGRQDSSACAPIIPLSELKDAVRELDHWEEDSELFQAGLIVLAPLSINSMDPGAIAAFIGVPQPIVTEYAERLRANGVWLPNGKIAVSSDDPESGQVVVELILQALVAIGHVEYKPSAECEDAQTVAVAEPGAADGKEASTQEASDAP